MATTTPDNIYSPDAGQEYALTQDLLAMADTVQDALTSIRTRSGVLKGPESSRPAPGNAGSYWSSTDTGRLWYDNGVSWEVRSFSGCLLRTATNQTTDGSTAFAAQPLVWDTEDYDTDNYHNAGALSRLTIPFPGYYRVTAKIRTASTAFPGGVLIRKNGTDDLNSRVISTQSSQAAAYATVTKTYKLAPGDFIEACGLAGAVSVILNVSECFVEIVKVG